MQTLRHFQTLCGRPLRPYVVGHPDLMWSDTPTLRGRTLRPYVVGHPDLIGMDTPALCGQVLKFRPRNLKRKIRLRILRPRHSLAERSNTAPGRFILPIPRSNLDQLVRARYTLIHGRFYTYRRCILGWECYGPYRQPVDAGKCGNGAQVEYDDGKLGRFGTLMEQKYRFCICAASALHL